VKPTHDGLPPKLALIHIRKKGLGCTFTPLDTVNHLCLLDLIKQPHSLYYLSLCFHQPVRPSDPPVQPTLLPSHCHCLHLSPTDASRTLRPYISGKSQPFDSAWCATVLSRAADKDGDPVVRRQCRPCIAALSCRSHESTSGFPAK